MSFDKDNIEVGALIRSNNYDYDFLILEVNTVSKIPTINFLSRKIPAKELRTKRITKEEFKITEETSSLSLFLQRGFGEIYEDELYPNKSMILAFFEYAANNPTTKITTKARTRILDIIKSFPVFDELEAA